MKDWTNSLKYAKTVIMAKGDTLISRDMFNVMWSLEYERNEDLLVLGFTNFDYPTTRSLGYQLLENGYGDIVATNDIYQLYEAEDIRKVLVSVSSNVNYCNKYPGRNYTIGLDNIRVLRLSEMYLTAAEACAEKPALEDSAMYYISKLRRARIKDAENITDRGAILRNIIQEERRRELAFEGHRLFDIIRRGNDVTRKDVISGAPVSKNWGDNKLIMPIPQREMDANKNMVQNPGY